MRALVQRILSAEVQSEGKLLGQAECGLLVYLAVAHGDDIQTAERMAQKIVAMRIFEDDNGKMNLSVQDVGGDVLAIPNFTLLADACQGRRPSFVEAAPPGPAEAIYEAFVSALSRQGLRVKQGAFGKHMAIRSLADGPVNVLIEMPGSSPGRRQQGGRTAM